MISSRSKRRKGSLAAFLALLVISGMFFRGAAAAPAFEAVSVPGSVDASESITVTARISSQMPIQSVVITVSSDAFYGENEMALVSGNLTEGTWTYLIPAQFSRGRVTLSILARDDGGNHTRYPEMGHITVDVTGASPPGSFPWGIFITVAFLGVALVLVELAFKPGFYRPTGRERARRLEEEDRKREEERAAKEGAENGQNGSGP